MSTRLRNYRLATRRDLIASVVAAYEHQYGTHWGDTVHGSSRDTFARLCALPATATRQDVNAVMGNASWTVGWCHSCTEDVESAIIVGGNEYDAGHSICSTCARAALREMRKLLTATQLASAAHSTPEGPAAS